GSYAVGRRWDVRDGVAAVRPALDTEPGVDERYPGVRERRTSDRVANGPRDRACLAFPLRRTGDEQNLARPVYRRHGTGALKQPVQRDPDGDRVEPHGDRPFQRHNPTRVRDAHAAAAGDFIERDLQRHALERDGDRVFEWWTWLALPLGRAGGRRRAQHREDAANRDQEPHSQFPPSSVADEPDQNAPVVRSALHGRWALGPK